MSRQYVPLHNHTIGSLLDGLVKPSELAKRAAAIGMPACAISDHGTISQIIKFYKACKEENIKPTLGVEGYFTDDISIKKGSKNYHILFLAKSNRGIKSLFKLLTRANDDDAFYYRPRIDMDMIYEYAEDLICSTACSGGLLSHPNYLRVVHNLHQYFEDDFYVEIMPLDFEGQVLVNNRAVEIMQSEDIRMIATGDAHYLHESDKRLHNFLLNVNTGGKMQFEVEGLYLKTREEMEEAFQKNCPYLDASLVEQALDETLLVADKCEIDWPATDIVLPHMADDPDAELYKHIKVARSKNKTYQERLDYEFGIIKEKKFSPYFLLVHDFIKWAKSVKMPLGCGRGSAGGSLLCYVLGITDIDPIENDLLFERFLNPERTDWPDIDLDFSQARRHECIEYLQKRWGKERVAYISTFSGLKLKSAWKDVAKALGVPFQLANFVSADLDNEKTMGECVEENSNIARQLADFNLDDIIYYTDGLTGTYRQGGTHAAGIVIAPSEISDFGSLERRSKNRCICFDMDDVSYQGLVKIDVLGLRTLDILDETLQLVKRNHRETVNWNKVKIDTPDILEEFGKGNTIGIFQFEKGPTHRLVKQLDPITSKSILVDCNALVRPGPLDSGMTETYVKRHTGKGGDFDEAYADWLLKGPGADIAKNTYQVIIYQEQVISVLQKLAGYSVPQSDTIRRVMAKKKGDIEAYRKAFIAGCKETVEMPEEVASTLFDNLATFSRYGFNKSHAAAYTELGLRQMFLKLRFPLEYMTALFKCTTEEEKKIQFVDDCIRLNVPIEAPDINESDAGFKIKGDGIRIGLSAIKNVGDKAVAHILKQRKYRPFRDLVDFRSRVPKSEVNRKSLESLILSGSLDSLGANHKLWPEIIDMEPLDIAETLKNAKPPVDFSFEQKEMNKAVLIPGIWKIHLAPEIGLDIFDEEALEMIREFTIDCQACSLWGIYKCPVSFEYTRKSRIMVIAEAPGEDETKLGRPLIGKAGDEMFKHLAPYGFTRADFFLTNVYKCRPLNNKLPLTPPQDCWEILKNEIEVLKPKFILALGNRVREFFTGEVTGIQAAADKLRCEVEIVGGKPISVLYAVHPSSCLYPRGQDNIRRWEKTAKLLNDIVNGDYQEERREWGGFETEEDI